MKKALLITATTLILSLPALADDQPPKSEIPEPTHIAVPLNVMQAILETLQQRPYAEVAQVMEAYRQSAQPITIETTPKEE